MPQSEAEKEDMPRFCFTASSLQMLAAMRNYAAPPRHAGYDMPEQKSSCVDAVPPPHFCSF